MSKLHNIQSVAKYESKLLMRSWFYRIFFVLAILFLCIFNIVALVAEQGGFWLMKALPANIPYLNLLLLNTGQAIIAVFLSSEFLKSDKKLDTSEVFYVHPLSNAEYVIGKIWGNMSVFIRLDLIIILLVVLFNIISGVTVDWSAYIVYFFLICVPTLIYIFGLSVGLMLLLKNQAITFVILLGYIALTLFYIGDKFYFLFDYMAYNLPMVKSTIVGFSNWGVLFNHRIIYFSIGVGFICLSIFLFRRLPNTKYGGYRWLGLSGVFVLIGIFSAYNHVDTILGAAKMRQLYTEVNNRFVESPKMVIDRYDIALEQQPHSIYTEVEMSGVALQKSNIFTFCLNPGLKVLDVTQDDVSLPFEREHQILLIDFKREIDQGDSIRFKVIYEGAIDEDFCYLDIPSDILQERHAQNMFNINKKYGFQSDSYLLFTPETYWYPRPGTSYSSESPDWQQAYFSHFRLKVKTINNLKALSQGKMKWPVVRRMEIDVADQVNDSKLVAERDSLRGRRSDRSGRSGERRPEERRSERGTTEGRPAEGRRSGNARSEGRSISGSRGSQERPRRERRASSQGEVSSDSVGKQFRPINKKTKVVTDVEYDSIFIYETDFLTPSISLVIGDYEQKSIEVDETLYSIWHIKGHDYFSSVFQLIADTIPAQIREQRRLLENSYSLDYSFNRFSIIEVPVQFYSYVRTWTQAQEVMQPEMVLFPENGSLMNDANVAKNVKDEISWAKQSGEEISDEEAQMRVLNRFLRIFQRTESNLAWSQNRGSANVTSKPNPYFIFPQLYNFRYNIFSSEWPIANRLIEIYLQNKRDNSGDWMRQINGISNSEKANLLMEKASFKELLADPKQRDLLDNVISLKANYLFAYGEQNVGFNEFRDSLRLVLQRNIFSNLRFESLLDTMGRISQTDLLTPLNSWNYPTPLPAYVVGTPEVIQITNRGTELFVVNQTVTNDSDNDGIIDVEINFGGRGGDFYDPRKKRKVALKKRETKKMVSVWEDAPRSIMINTLISANLPNVINLPLNNIIRERNKPIPEEGDFTVDGISSDLPGEIIVDNEDSLLFELSAPDVVGLLPQWLDRMDNNSFRYSGVSDWRPPLQWSLTTNENYYGTYIRSAYVIKSGSGNQTATWKIPVPEAGRYDLYYYVSKPEELRWGRGRGRRNRSGGDAEYHFKVRYGDDEEDAYINLRRAEDGWSILGTYFFDADTIHVVLGNDCTLRTVTADAVKIVRR